MTLLFRSTPALLVLTFAALLLVAAQSGPAQNRNSVPTAENGAIPQNAQNKPLSTISGEISDSLCPRYHYVLANSTAAECTRYCIAHQAHYILKSGNKIYTLHDRPGHLLDALAGKQARVTGWLVDPDTIEVKSVSSEVGK